MRIVDRFTTRDGEWYPSDKPYSISKEMAEKYQAFATGAAHHIFVRVPVACRIEFISGSHVVLRDGGPQYHWIETPIFESYDPKASDGPWHVWIDGQRITKDGEGIGLPYSWHVSTFLVVEDSAEVEPPPPVQGDKYQLYRNGVLVWESEPPSMEVNERGALRALGFSDRSIDQLPPTTLWGD